MARKPGMGRKKIPMAVIENPSHRNVTFSKRRGSIFKKADELCTLCGAEVGLIVFSPAGKAYSYGSPDVDTITNRLMAGGDGNDSPRGKGLVDILNGMLNQIQGQSEMETKRREEMDERQRVEEENGGGCWWRKEEYPETETETLLLKDSMEALKLRVVEEAEKVAMTEAAVAMTSLPFFFDGSSPANPKLYGAGPSSAAPSMYGSGGGSGFRYRQQGPF